MTDKTERMLEVAVLKGDRQLTGTLLLTCPTDLCWVTSVAINVDAGRGFESDFGPEFRCYGCKELLAPHGFTQAIKR